jgi:DNA-binding NarL/FixJ family response regulator
MNILIADDNDKMRALIKNLLFENIRSVNTIYECKNGKQAIEGYFNYKPDWILLDIRMNSMDGLTAAEKIKQKDPNAKIIIITNYDEASYRNRAKSISVFAYILKENLNELINILIENRRQETESSM